MAHRRARGSTTSLAVVIALGALVYAAWARAWIPPWDQQDWPKQIFEHRCAEITIRPDSSVHVHCARDGSVAALEAPVDFSIASRLAARAWMRRADASQRRTGVMVSATDTLVIVEQTTCGMCRRVMGHTWAFRPAHAPAPLLRRAQEAAGLPARPPLRTLQAWQAAVRP
ncbi:MAG: hypothetical protein IT379_00265 [Deltaproteobacteria bacterium]|nr:hypothetical protein [Deltaproteobacteria bacterium]